MPGTVVANLTTISLCEATTGWTAVGGTNALNDPTVFDAKQGSYCMQNYAAAAGNRGADYDFGVNTDLSDTTLYLWFAFSKVPHATNYMRIRVTDAAGNWGEWNLFNKATLPHLSWICWTVKTTVPFDQTGGTNPTMTQIRKVGWRMDAVVAKVYIYWDAWRYGDGLTIYGGTLSDPARIEDLYLADSDTSNAYGVIDKYNGVYFIQGKIRIGSTTSGQATYFKDVNQVVVFKSIKGNPTGFYEIKGQGNASASTYIYFGEEVGGQGVSGCYVQAGVEKFTLDFSDTNITDFGFYGCSFKGAGSILGQPSNENKKFLSSSFIQCGEMQPSTGIVESCNFISAPGRAVRIDSTSHNVKKCNFINCYVAVRHGAGGTYGYDALMFYGNTYDVENTSFATVYINRQNGSNPSSNKFYKNPGDIVLNPMYVYLTLSGLKTGSEVRVYDQNKNEIAGTESSGTSFQFYYDYQPDTYVDIVVHHLGYLYYRIEDYLLPSTNTTIPVAQQLDRQYLNP